MLIVMPNPRTNDASTSDTPPGPPFVKEIEEEYISLASTPEATPKASNGP